MRVWEIYWIILLLGALQGLILGGVLLLGKKGHRQSKIFLALLLFLSAYQLAVEFFRSALVTLDDPAYYFLLELHWAYAPLLYSFIRSFLDASFRIQGKSWWWFLPIPIQIAFSTWVKVQNLFWTGNPADLPWSGSESYQVWEHTPFEYLVLAGLLFAVSRALFPLIRQVEDRARNPEQKVALQWLRTILWVFQGFSLLLLLVTLTDYLFYDYAFAPFYQFPLFIGLAGLTYWLALSGFARREATLPPPPPDRKPQGSEWDALLGKIDHHFEQEKAHLDPELNLQKVADALQVKSYQVTRALNQVRQQTFSQFLNAHRVRTAQELIRDPQYAHYTLLAIGHEAGFNSKASFNRVFKASTGMTPGAYRKAE